MQGFANEWIYTTSTSKFLGTDMRLAIAAGHGLSIDVIWIFAEVGNRIPADPVLPVPSNAHWLPLASLVQVPTILLFGPTPLASLLPFALIGSLTAPLTWAIARDLGYRPTTPIDVGVPAFVDWYRDYFRP